MGNYVQEEPSLEGLGHNLSPLARAVKAMGLAPEGDQLFGVGLSAEIVENILNARAVCLKVQCVHFMVQRVSVGPS